MSILIEDLEFPKNCSKCPLGIVDDEYVYCPLFKGHITAKMSKRQRMKSCGLKEVETTETSLPNLLC